MMVCALSAQEETLGSPGMCGYRVAGKGSQGRALGACVEELGSKTPVWGCGEERGMASRSEVCVGRQVENPELEWAGRQACPTRRPGSCLGRGQ